jgi:hypothetical protein
MPVTCWWICCHFFFSYVLTSRTANAPMTIVIPGIVRVIQTIERAVVPSPDDFVDLAEGLLIIQIVDFSRIRVAQIPLSIHISGISTHFFNLILMI